MTFKQETIQKINLTNEESFQLLFNQYYVPLCLFAEQYVDSRAQAKDIAQDSFLKLWELRKNFGFLHQVKSFLYTTVKNKALNEIEHETVKRNYQENAVDKTSDTFFYDHLIEEETYRILHEAMESLPAQMHAIIELALEGMPNKEIAEKLTVSTETVHTLKKMAYVKLRAKLAGQYYQYPLLLTIYMAGS